MSASSDLARAHRYVQGRDFAQAAPLYLKIVNEAAENTPAWEGLLLSLGGLGLADKALALVGTRQQRFNDGLAFYHASLTRMVPSGFGDIAETLVAATPDTTTLYVVARYVAGIIALQRHKPESAAGHLAAAAAMAEKFREQFWPHPFLQKIIIEGRQFGDFAALDALIARPRAEVIAESGIIAPAAQFHDPGATAAPFVLCAGMNEPYLDRFGEKAVTAAAAALADIPDAVFHLHLLDETPALAGKIAALRTLAAPLRLGVSTETYRHALEGYGRASYYAAARFLRAPEIMAHYGKRLMIVDIDIARLAHIPQVMSRFGGASYGCFEQSGQLPGNICHASIIAIGADAPAQRFADLTAKLIARRAASEPFWLLDQTSILVASRYLATHDADFSAIELAAATGLAFDDCFVSNGTAKEKQSMRAARAVLAAASAA